MPSSILQEDRRKHFICFLLVVQLQLISCVTGRMSALPFPVLENTENAGCIRDAQEQRWGLLARPDETSPGTSRSTLIMAKHQKKDIAAASQSMCAVWNKDIKIYHWLLAIS